MSPAQQKHLCLRLFSAGQWRRSAWSGSKMLNPEEMQVSVLTPFDEMPASVWVRACCRHIYYYRSTLISAGQGRHRSAVTAPVNVWTTKDTSYYQQEQANISDVYQFVSFFLFFFGPARLELRSHLSYKFTSEFKQLCCVPHWCKAGRTFCFNVVLVWWIKKLEQMSQLQP